MVDKVEFPYRVEREGEETVWMWHKGAAIAKAEPPYANRTRRSRVVDERTDRVVAAFNMGRNLAESVTHAD